MEIYLIRHGHCEDSGYNPELTETGVAQARRLAERLAAVSFDRIYHSDLIRAADTAKILSGAVPSALAEDARFREIDMGDILLSSWSGYPELYGEWVNHERDLPYPNGESGAMAWARYKSALEDIVCQDYERVAVVAHGGAIRVMICGMLGISQEKRFLLGMPVENCSVSIAVYTEDRRYILNVFNDSSHLRGLD